LVISAEKKIKNDNIFAETCQSINEFNLLVNQSIKQ